MFKSIRKWLIILIIASLVGGFGWVVGLGIKDTMLEYYAHTPGLVMADEYIKAELAPFTMLLIGFFGTIYVMHNSDF